MPKPATLPSVHLRTDELHPGPWVYARQVADEDGWRPPSGSLVEVFDASERFLGHALYNDRSDVRLRWLSRGKRSALARPRDFLLQRLRAADRLRRKTLRLEQTTDTYRIAHAEGDDLPGLIVDRLADHLVCEHHALGFWNLREDVGWALGQLYPGFAVHHRIPKAARNVEGFEDEVPFDQGDQGGQGGQGGEGDEGDDEAVPRSWVWIEENGIRYPVAPGAGHKTGWFCDQRENRRRIGALAAGRSVLDVCCNAGGFALSAARAGARQVTAVDLDEKALELAYEAAKANELEIEFFHEDGFDTLRSLLASRAPRPELVILDPPKLIRGRARMEDGKRKYRDWNALAIEATAPDGLLATFSCSGALDLASFLGLVFGAARRAGREVRLLEVLQAAPDHPQRPDWPRSRYLKGALLSVDRGSSSA